MKRFKIKVLHPRIIDQFEHDAKFQAKLHLVASYYWLANFPVIGWMFFFAPPIWLKVGLLLNTFYSLYANFATDYGAFMIAILLTPFCIASGRLQMTVDLR